MIHSEDDKKVLKQRQLFLMGGIGFLALILVIGVWGVMEQKTGLRILIV